MKESNYDEERTIWDTIGEIAFLILLVVLFVVLWVIASSGAI